MAPDSLNCNHIEVDVQPSWQIVFQGGSSRLTSTILGKWLIIWMPKSEMRSNFGCNHPYPPYPQWHPFLGGSIYIYIIYYIKENIISGLIVRLLWPSRSTKTIATSAAPRCWQRAKRASGSPRRHQLGLRLKHPEFAKETWPWHAMAIDSCPKNVYLWLSNNKEHLDEPLDWISG